MKIDGQAAKSYASQGQTRTAALSLKLAAREIFQQDTGEYPVLLLDDVLSELDPRRQEFVLNRIRGGQVFITCCEDDRLPQLLGGRIFHIKEGWMAEQRSGAMENRKIKVKSLISVTAWVVALGMFIAYLFLKRQWMLFTIDFAILLSCLLGISDPEEDRRSKNVYWILLITRVMDVAIRCV